MIIKGDCIEELKKLPENSVDAIVTDPPYGLEFMGKNWDYGVPGKKFFIEMIRVLKPGGFLLAFGGTRTYHRLACGIEDAGFEIRDCIQWLYGSGFPKSLNIGKQIDKIEGNEREVVGTKRCGIAESPFGSCAEELKHIPETKGNSDWEGWGTALKPANEPIVVARKPLSEKNVALNVLKWGTAGINIDECRINYQSEKDMEGAIWGSHGTSNAEHNWGMKDKGKNHLSSTTGRFPANIILDEEAGKMLDEQTGSLGNSFRPNNIGKDYKSDGMFGGGKYNQISSHNDKGGASRFFYCAKASKSERNEGLEDFEEKEATQRMNASEFRYEEGREPTPRAKQSVNKNNHPTVKPIKLMEYLIKLVSKEGATVLDPFLGSGTTAIACLKQNRKYIGIEKEKEYIKIAEARLKPFIEQRKLSFDNLNKQEEKENE